MLFRLTEANHKRLLELKKHFAVKEDFDCSAADVVNYFLEMSRVSGVIDYLASMEKQSKSS